MNTISTLLQMEFISKGSKGFRYRNGQPIDCKDIFVSEGAMASILSEVLRYGNKEIETGVLLLGFRNGNQLTITDTIDPGYGLDEHSRVTFEYDPEYATHRLRILNREYEVPRSYLGVLHRHPGSFDRFSDIDFKSFSADLQYNAKRRGLLYPLVNIDPDFRVTWYYISAMHNIYRIPDRCVHLVSDADLPGWMRERKSISEALRASGSNIRLRACWTVETEKNPGKNEKSPHFSDESEDEKTQVKVKEGGEEDD